MLKSCIGVVHVASGLGLVLLNRVGKEIDGVALLITLIETSVLWLASLLRGRRVIVEERSSVTGLQLPAPSFLFFLAELDCFRKIVIVIGSVLSALALLPVFLLLILACLKGQAVFSIFLLVHLSPRLLSSVCLMHRLSVLGGELFESSNTRLPRSSVASLGSESFFVKNKGG